MGRSPCGAVSFSSSACCSPALCSTLAALANLDLPAGQDGDGGTLPDRAPAADPGAVLEFAFDNAMLVAAGPPPGRCVGAVGQVPQRVRRAAEGDVQPGPLLPRAVLDDQPVLLLLSAEPQQHGQPEDGQDGDAEQPARTAR